MRVALFLLFISMPFKATPKVVDLKIDVKEVQCLADNIYFESRGEGEEGMIAVANVTLNRTKHPNYPSSICDVVYQKDQFSWVKKRKELKKREDYIKSLDISLRMYENQVDNTKGALHFYAHKKVKPDWSVKMRPTRVINNHTFLRPV